MDAMTRRAFLGLLGASPLAAGGFWERKIFPKWSERDVERMLTDSPWARTVGVEIKLRPRNGSPLASAFSDVGLPRGTGWPRPGIGLPGGLGWPGGGSQVPTSRPAPGQGGGAPPMVTRGEAYLTIRWSSALPIRQAMLLDTHGSLREAPADEVEALRSVPKEFVVEVFGIPGQVIQTDRRRMEELLVETSQLTLPGRRPISATEAHAPIHGQYRFLTLRFPKDEPITVDNKEVEFFASAGPFEIKEKFKLKEMVYGGRLEL